jgi:flagellar L-ring protein precursor FlgH
MPTVKRFAMLVAVVGVFVCLNSAVADSLWERRDPYFAGSMYWDTKARRVGDVVTIVLNETTNFQGQETRTLKKNTVNSADAAMSGAFSEGKRLSHTFSGNLKSAWTSDRELNGTSNLQSNRNLVDNMAVQVIQVLPNRNLVVEGFRTRVVAGEERTIRVSGIIRPDNIGINDTIQSQFVANFTVEYFGKGIETTYTTNGWLGRIVNKVWPY